MMLVVPEPPDTIGGSSSVLVEHFFRTEAGRLTAHLVRRFGAHRLELCEDAVQSALEKALLAWPRRGTPDNPSAWLTTAARNFALDRLRTGARVEVEADEAVLVPHASDPPRASLHGEIEDDTLRMLLVCCDEELPVQTRLVLSLKLVCGFSLREIASRLFLGEEAAQKVISRGRESLKDLMTRADDAWDAPSAARLEQRLASAQHVVYLLFNEGYSSQKVDEPIRRELCDEALRLGQLLVSGSETGQPSSFALLSLLHFLAARLDPAGHLLLLEEQDRSRWDQQHIREGLRCFSLATETDSFSRYHGEAAIQLEHCLAPSFAETRWAEIVDFYEILERLAPSPLYTLNRAIALAQLKGPRVGLELLEANKPPAWLGGYYLWGATLGELHRQNGAFDRAERYLEQAIELAPTNAEKALFTRRLEQCRAGSSARSRRP
jgi:RNA polymerase sigma factor (sigma-70 family)